MPTENRSSNTEMASVPREHELKIRQTPLADLLSGLKTGEVRDCSDREFAVGDTVLLREIDDARDYTGTVLRRTITHVQKHYGLPDHLCVLSYGQPAPQPHPEPIAWMFGTAFWWTKEEAERDAAETGLAIVGLGPMTGSAEVEQLREVIKHSDAQIMRQSMRISNQRAQLAERDALLADIKTKLNGQCWAWPGLIRRIDELSASAEPNAPIERDERAAFEAWANQRTWFNPQAGAKERDDCTFEYADEITDHNWISWQARAALERKPS